MAPEEENAPAEKRGIDRRTLIRRSAAVGAAARVAPVIIGSLSSPAAAQTAPCGCTRVAANAAICNVNCNNVPCSQEVPECVPEEQCRNEFTACIVANQADCTGSSGPVTFSVVAGCLPTCQITDGAGNVGGQAACVNGTGLGNSITFPGVGDPGGPANPYNQFAIKVDCGPCPT
jgi:hypothetical protein